MRWSRALSTSVATLTVIGCAAFVVGMHSPSDQSASSRDDSVAATYAPRVVAAAVPGFASLPSASADAAAPSGATSPTVARSAAAATVARSGRAASTSAPASTPVQRAPKHAVVVNPQVGAPRPHAVASKSTPKPPPPKQAAPTKGVRLPLGYPTGSATRVLTVTASSTGSTIATLQPWAKAAGGGWTKVGSSVTAHIGADGMSTHPSESRSATPMGSFTLTQAFGYNSNPGTNLPYFTTTPADYWISDAGSNYNTHQRCPSYNTGCDNDGVNERLYYETPYYNYAVVIDYNTQNAPGGVRAGAGSAFFLHVYPAGTGATAGCVAIPQASLVPIMRWLTPSAHPRILIGTV